MSTKKKQPKSNNIVNGVDLSPGKFLRYGVEKEEIFKILRKTKKKLFLFDINDCSEGERTIGNLFDVEKNITNKVLMHGNFIMKSRMKEKLSEKRKELKKMEKLFAKVKKA